ncbi:MULTISPECIES: tellurite resistance/C4-dicarboxylate transporter family protein [unclassified Streptomyces]|uniref:tellurite resistance/C4-dicarboxylate transporter family protein n=1 Tax=unclassified Streptomyces TaxID=2593676 RepID=UPI00382CCEB5
MNLLTPAAGTVVMATAIISVGFGLTGHRTLSVAALVVAGVLWAALAAVFAVRLLHCPERWRKEALTPPALTAVAATCILGTCLSQQGLQTAAAAALALSAALWPALLVPVLRGRQRGLPGVVFLVCVATEALAVGAATLALARRLDWLCGPALAFALLGVALYGVAFGRFDRHQIRTGSGDHWIAGGALSIVALACDRLTAAADPDGPLGWAPALHAPLRAAALVLLAAALLWLPVLVYAELRWPRRRYDIRRWATVFPLGMTAVSALSAAAPTGFPGLDVLGRVLLWVAVAAWLLTAAGAVRSARRGGGSP